MFNRLVAILSKELNSVTETQTSIFFYLAIDCEKRILITKEILLKIFCHYYDRENWKYIQQDCKVICGTSIYFNVFSHLKILNRYAA